MANPNNTISPAPQMAMQVTTDKPLCKHYSQSQFRAMTNFLTGFYCKQATHCGKGMVFSINPTAEKTHAQFKEKAMSQNGAPPAGAPPAAAPASGAPAPGGTLPPILGGPPPAQGAAPTNGAQPPSQTQPGSGMATGIGQVNNGQCTCSCLCGVASFPNPALQGRGAFGGMSGAMPMAALEK